MNKHTGLNMKRRTALGGPFCADDYNDQGLPRQGRPLEIVRDPALSRDEKRALLAAWASDERAIEGLPTLRQLDDGTIVRVHEVLEALAALDGDVSATAFPATTPRRAYVKRAVGRQRIPARLLDRLRARRGPDDDDDDPPGAPATAAVPRLTSAVEAIAGVAPRAA